MLASLTASAASTESHDRRTPGPIGCDKFRNQGNSPQEEPAAGTQAILLVDLNCHFYLRE
jgi:hypothetical protein